MKPATCAYVGAALFVALMMAFGSIGNTTPPAVMILAIGLIGVTSHVVLLPVVNVSGSASWTRACGYGWLVIDVMLNVAAINGMTLAAATPLRLGGHLPAAVWIADAALSSPGAARPVGVVLAALLAGHAVSAPWIPPWILFIPFMLIPVWLVLVGRSLSRAPRVQTVPGFAAS